MIDHALASAMQSLDILLLDRLLRDERDVRLAGGGGNRFSVVAVVLLPAHKGLNILRADDLHPVAKCLKLTSPAERARAGFDPNRAALDLCNNTEKRVAHRPPL